MTADNHLGRHYDRMFSHRLEERRAWLRRGFASAVEYALEQRAHLFLQVGDLFDTPEPRNVERQFVAEALARLRAAGVRCAGIGGNHDTPRTRNGRPIATPQGTYARLGGLRLLGDASGQMSDVSHQHSALSTQHPVLGTAVDTETFELEGLRVAVGGMAPDPTAPAGSDPLEGVVWQPEADLSLLLLHGSLEGHIYPGAAEPIIRRRTVEALEGVDCLLVGHIHRHAALRWGGRTVIVPGATERMTFGDLDCQPGFVYVEAEPGRPVALRHVPVGCQPRMQVVILASDLAGGEPAELLKARLETIGDRSAMVRVSLEGPISRQRYHDLRLREAAEYGAARCFFLDLDTTGLYVEDELHRTAHRGGRLSQREELARFARELWQDAESGEERSLIDEATRAILDEYQ